VWPPDVIKIEVTADRRPGLADAVVGSQVLADANPQRATLLRTAWSARRPCGQEEWSVAGVVTIIARCFTKVSAGMDDEPREQISELEVQIEELTRRSERRWSVSSIFAWWKTPQIAFLTDESRSPAAAGRDKVGRMEWPYSPFARAA
jgi:hypothetical protein